MTIEQRLINESLEEMNEQCLRDFKGLVKCKIAAIAETQKAITDLMEKLAKQREELKSLKLKKVEVVL